MSVRFGPRSAWIGACLILLSFVVALPAAPAEAATRGSDARREADLFRLAEPADAATLAAGVLVEVSAAAVATAPEVLWLELEPGAPESAYRTGFEVVAEGHAVWRGSFADDPPGYTSITLSLIDGEVIGSIERIGRGVYKLNPLGPGRGELRRGEPLVSQQPTARYLAAVRAAASGPPRAQAGEPTDAPALPPLIAAPATHVADAMANIEVRMLFIATPRAVDDGSNQSQAQHGVDATNTVFINNSIPGRLRLAGWEVEDLGLDNSNSLGQLIDRSISHQRAQQLKDQYAADLVTVVFKSPEEATGCVGSNPLLANSTKANYGDAAFAFMASWCLPNVHSGEITKEYVQLFGASGLPGQTPRGTISYAHGYRVEGEFRTLVTNTFTGCDCPQLMNQLSDPRVTRRGTPVGVVDEADNARVVREHLAMVAGFEGAQPPPPPPPPPKTEPPAAPSDLTATAVSSTEVDLAWTDGSSDETGFQVQIEPPGGSWSLVTTAPADSTTYRVTGLEAGTLYGFRVRAVNNGGGSKYSNRAAAQTQGLVPLAPAGLTAAPASSTSVTLEFPAVADATGYQVEVHTADPAKDRTEAMSLIGDSAVVEGLEPASPYTFRVRAANAHGVSAWSEAASATTFGAGGATAPCVADAGTLCLLGGRFEVEVAWRNPREPFTHGTGAARTVPGSQRTGLFTFFNPDNVELVVKMLDGRPVNGAYWVFYGALSDVEYWISVRDTEDGALLTYRNQPFEICGVGDNAAFLPDAQDEPEPLRYAAPLPAPVSGDGASGARLVTAAAEGSCVPSPTALCLADARFRVEVDYDNPRLAGDAGPAHVFDGLGTDLSGYFWFFRQDNLELAVKILDGRALNDHHWIFWGGLSDVAYDIRVTDTVSGQVREFSNPAFSICGGAVNDQL